MRCCSKNIKKVVHTVNAIVCAAIEPVHVVVQNPGKLDYELSVSRGQGILECQRRGRFL